MAFGTNSESYQNLVTTGKTLMEALLGDFDFAELDEAHWLMGPLLFISFVMIAVFVTLNMIIAIISDAYTEAAVEVASMEDVKLGKEMVSGTLLTKLTAYSPTHHKIYICFAVTMAAHPPRCHTNLRFLVPSHHPRC